MEGKALEIREEEQRERTALKENWRAEREAVFKEHASFLCMSTDLKGDDTSSRYNIQYAEIQAVAVYTKGENYRVTGYAVRLNVGSNM